MEVRVKTGGRLHFGFRNLSLVHDRLYGGIGTAISSPKLVLDIEPASGIEVDDPLVKHVVKTAVDWLSVKGARVHVRQSLPAHVGLGSGTQHALAVLGGLAKVYGLSPSMNEAAPALGRGGRSGIGVTAFERGGFVMDAGQPVDEFTTGPPQAGGWSVPNIITRHELPDAWRFILVIPSTTAGRHGESEEASMRRIIENADDSIVHQIATICTQRLLPAIVNNQMVEFGRAISEIGRLNGIWYTEVQGGIYRPPVGRIVKEFEDNAPIGGAGQSSWGPTVYGVTEVDKVKATEKAARDILEDTDIEGSVHVVKPRNHGADIDVLKDG